MALVNESKNSADRAKERSMALKAAQGVEPEKEAMIGGLSCTKAQFDEWLTAPLAKQILLEEQWGLLWRPAYQYTPKEIKPAEPVVADSVAATLAQRGSRYGDFTDHARICQALKVVMIEEGRWENLSDVQKQALEVIADKIARILSGDPNYDDNWHDIQGYAKLVEDRLPCNQGKN